MNTSSADALFPLPADPSPDGHTSINPTLWFVDRDGYRVVFCRHEPLYRLAVDDQPHLRYVAVMLRQTELATQAELARAFGHSVAAQRRWERRFQQDGLDGLDNHFSSGRGRKLDRTQEQFVRRWFQQGLSQAEIARRLGVGAATVDRTCKRLGLQRPSASVPELPWDPVEILATETEACAAGPSAAPDVPLPTEAAVPAREAGTAAAALEPASCPETAAPGDASAAAVPASPIPGAGEPARLPASFTLDHDPSHREGDRFLASQGLLADAVPLFADAEHLPRAGVLLAVPLLIGQQVLPVFEQVYGSLFPSFYGLRTLVVTLILMALLRIKRPENLKEYSPDDLGRLLGLDRAPEVKTVCRKLSELAARAHGKRLQDALARQRIGQQTEAVAFLYLDGHVREYHGQEPLAKAKKPQSAVAKPAATDFWVNDAHGVPLLVVTNPMNAALTQVLLPIVRDVKALVPSAQRITVLFDRGGFSAKLFRLLIDEGFDVITYRKGKRRLLPQRCFSAHTLESEGRRLTYQLCDQPRVRVGRLHATRKKRRQDDTPAFLWLRQVTVLRDEGGQTPVLTNRTDLRAVEVVVRLFGRWRQENYFKYMIEEFALDALVEYGAEDVPSEADRPNPQRRPVMKRLRQAQAEVMRLQAALGEEAAANAEAERPTMRGFKIAHAELRRQLQGAEARVQRLKEKLRQLPKRIPASDLRALKQEKRLIVDAIKIIAYQIETKLLGMLQEHYARTEDEGRTLLQAAFQSCGRLEVLPEELRVTIAAQSSPHRTQALAALCTHVNALGTCFPGTNLQLRLAVESHEPLTP
jgi:transposase